MNEIIKCNGTITNTNKKQVMVYCWCAMHESSKQSHKNDVNRLVYFFSFYNNTLHSPFQSFYLNSGGGVCVQCVFEESL